MRLRTTIYSPSKHQINPHHLWPHKILARPLNPRNTLTIVIHPQSNRCAQIVFSKRAFPSNCRSASPLYRRDDVLIVVLMSIRNCSTVRECDDSRSLITRMPFRRLAKFFVSACNEETDPDAINSAYRQLSPVTWHVARFWQLAELQLNQYLFDKI